MTLSALGWEGPQGREPAAPCVACALGTRCPGEEERPGVEGRTSYKDLRRPEAVYMPRGGNQQGREGEGETQRTGLHQCIWGAGNAAWRGWGSDHAEFFCLWSLWENSSVSVPSRMLVLFQ